MIFNLERNKILSLEKGIDKLNETAETKLDALNSKAILKDKINDDIYNFREEMAKV